MKMPRVNMPNILVSDLTQDEIRIIKLCLNGEYVRATKPKVIKTDHLTGKAAYVWRMVCFIVSPKRAHHCMPVGADFDLPITNCFSDEARTMKKELKKLEDVVIDSIPKNQWHGIKRWSSALT